MRQTYFEILDRKSLTADDRAAFESSIPACSADASNLIEVSKAGVDLFFLYGAMKCGELHPCRNKEGKIMAAAPELMEAFKQDRYAYKSLAEKRFDQVVILSLFVGVTFVITLLVRIFA